MNENANGRTMYEQVPVVAELNKVAGFNPLKFLRKAIVQGAEVLQLDLKYKKLWFRLRYPQGRIMTTVMRITEQIAIIEVKVFFDRSDEVPAASFIAERYAKNTPGGLYIETAQYAAADQALTDAGFGVQFSDVSGQADKEHYKSGQPFGKVVGQTETPIADQPVAVVQEQSPPPVAEPIAEVAVVTNEEPPLAVETPVAEVAIPVVETAVAMPIEETVVETAVAMPIEKTVVETTSSVEEIAPAVEAVVEEAPIAVAPVLTVAEMAPPVEEIVANEVAVPPTDGYTASMAVDDICVVMTLEEALEVIVDIGTCNGWTMAEVANRRPASLKWYLNGYAGENNILKAAAKLILESDVLSKAS